MVEREINEIWKSLIIGENKTLVIFEQGTLVILMKEKRTNPELEAIDIMNKYGPVYPGSPAGDFTVRKLQENTGWLVFYDHPDIINHVALAEIDQKRYPIAEEVPAVEVGLLGRGKRSRDAESLKIIHIIEI